jgi:hypothetical protein
LKKIPILKYNGHKTEGLQSENKGWSVDKFLTKINDKFLFLLSGIFSSVLNSFLLSVLVIFLPNSSSKIILSLSKALDKYYFKSVVYKNIVAIILTIHKEKNKKKAIFCLIP